MKTDKELAINLAKSKTKSLQEQIQFIEDLEGSSGWGEVTVTSDIKESLYVLLTNYANDKEHSVVKSMDKDTWTMFEMFKKHRVKFNEYLKEGKI